MHFYDHMPHCYLLEPCLSNSWCFPWPTWLAFRFCVKELWVCSSFTVEVGDWLIAVERKSRCFLRIYQECSLRNSSQISLVNVFNLWKFGVSRCFGVLTPWIRGKAGKASKGFKGALDSAVPLWLWHPCEPRRRRWIPSARPSAGRPPRPGAARLRIPVFSIFSRCIWPVQKRELAKRKAEEEKRKLADGAPVM